MRTPILIVALAILAICVACGEESRSFSGRAGARAVFSEIGLRLEIPGLPE